MRKIKQIYYKLKIYLRFYLVFILILNFNLTVFAFDESLNSNFLLLVNEQNTISRDFIPQNMKNIGDFMNITKSEILLREEAYNYLKLMYSDLKAVGLSVNGVSGYRDYDYQESLFYNEIKIYENYGYSLKEAEDIARTSVALGGSSEHQTGLAIDFSAGQLLSQDFGGEDVGIWLYENSYKYGFILSYPEDKIDLTKIVYEPWHFRFVGLPHSIYMAENNLILKEYIDLLKTCKHIYKIYDNIKYDIYYTENPNDEYDEILDVSYTNDGGYIITTYFEFSPLLVTVKNAYIKHNVFN